MSQLLQWGLGLLWLWVGVMAWRSASRGHGRGGYLCAALGLAFALAVTLRWHVQVLSAARAVLRALDFYSARMAFKVVLAVLVTVAVATGLRLGSRRLRRQPRGLRLALSTMVAFGVFLFALTAFLDDLLPGVIRRPPGRYFVELGFAATAALGIARWRALPHVDR